MKICLHKRKGRLFDGTMSFRIGATGLVLGLMVLLAGCSQKNESPAATPAERPAWAWANYPVTNRLRLAVLSCKVQPRSSLTLVAPMTGILRLHLATSQTNLEAGTVWAEFDPELFANESNVLSGVKARLDQREVMVRELELPRQKIKLTRDLWDSERQLAMLGWLHTNQDLAALPSSGLKNPDLRPEGIELASKESELLKLTLGALAATNLSVLGIDLESQQVEWQRRQLEFQRKQEQARIKMPFTGQLTVSLQLADKVTEYPVNMGQELGVARDLSQVQLRVSLSDPAWASVPANSLSATLRLPNGAELAATFAFKKVERIQNREEAVATFYVLPEHAKEAVRMLGMDVPGELWVALEKPVRVVPKLKLVLFQPSAFQNRNWADGVARLWPGARVAAEGQTELAIELADGGNP